MTPKSARRAQSTVELLQNELLTKDQVARIFQNHPNTIDKWVSKGDFPQGVSFGGQKLWPTEALKSLIQDRCKDLGYSHEQVQLIFSRAYLEPPGDFITFRAPVSSIQNGQKLSVQQLQAAIQEFCAELKKRPRMAIKSDICIAPPPIQQSKQRH